MFAPKTKSIEGLSPTGNIKGFVVVHLNIRSIRSKIDELHLLCSEAIPKIDCLCITESHLTSFDPDQLVYIPGNNYM